MSRRRRRRRPPKFDATSFNEDQPTRKDRVIDANCIAQESSSSHSLNGDVISQTPPSPKPSSSRWLFHRNRKKKQNHSARRNQNAIADTLDQCDSVRRNQTTVAVTLDQYEEIVKACEVISCMQHA